LIPLPDTVNTEYRIATFTEHLSRIRLPLLLFKLGGPPRDSAIPRNSASQYLIQIYFNLRIREKNFFLILKYFILPLESNFLFYDIILRYNFYDVLNLNQGYAPTLFARNLGIPQ